VNRRIYCLALLTVVPLAVAGCSAEPEVVAVTATPTRTPRPTATPEPSPTPIPDPSLGNLMFASQQDLSDAAPPNPVFDAGPEAIYASFEFAHIPADSQLTLRLERDGRSVAERNEAWQHGEEGSVSLLLTDDRHVLAPGSFDLELELAGQSLRGRFVISVVSGEPGALLISEPFDDNLLGWSEEDDEDQVTEIADGVLRLTQLSEGYLAWSDILPRFSDLDVSVDVRQEEGPADGYHGIVFRLGDDGFYFFTLWVDGYYGLARADEKGIEPLVEARWSNAILRGGETNRLRVVAQGSDLALYINDQQVATLSDDTLTRGALGLVSGHYSSAGMMSVFDNLTATLPLGPVEAAPEPAAPVATAQLCSRTEGRANSRRAGSQRSIRRESYTARPASELSGAVLASLRELADSAGVGAPQHLAGA